MAEKVEIPIVPSEVRGYLVLGRRLPEEMPADVKVQFMSGLWDMAKRDDTELAEMLSRATASPVSVDTDVVQSSDVDFTTAAAVATRRWMDQLIPKMSQPCYRMFAFPSHVTMRGERYDFVFLVLVFGNKTSTA